MSNSFDPYYRWLGIPPEHQPPDYYRLLALERFENDEEVIRDAAERQITHVRKYQLGEHAEIARKLLNELGRAKAILLDARKRMEYNQFLRTDQQVANAQTPTSPEVNGAQPSATLTRAWTGESGQATSTGRGQRGGNRPQAPLLGKSSSAAMSEGSSDEVTQVTPSVARADTIARRQQPLTESSPIQLIPPPSERAYIESERNWEEQRHGKKLALFGGTLFGIVLLLLLTWLIAVFGSRPEGNAKKETFARKCRVSGLVAYKGAPDTGSVVILLPTAGQFESLPDLADLRPESPRPGSRNPSLEAIREIGGDYDRVDEEGNVAFNVQSSRQYYVLYISRAGKVGNSGLTKTQRAEIGEFFFSPEDLIGRNQFRWITADIQGERMELDEVIFE